ncbi:glycosyltransferase family 2 protein [Candidatus Kaiserbacteria bacterium]|nr:glycosyltransferase family 2 protein [Candidatus Kaiserbacteria bacterium]
MRTPAVSVVIPTCNRPELLVRAIRSVCAQSYQDFEIIVVDDGDASARSLVDGFHDSRMRYIRHEPPRQGGAAARNTGVNAARGAFVAFLDDDDEWTPEKLSTQVPLLGNAGPNTVFSFSAVRNVYNDREEVTRVPAGEMNFLERSLTRFSGFLTSTLLVRRDALLGTGGFDASLPSHQEPDLIIRLSLAHDGVGIPKPLTIMSMSTEHPHIGSDLSKRIEGRIALLRKHARLFSTRPRILATHYFRIGLWSRDSGAARQAKKFFFLAFTTSPSPRYLFHCLAMLLR